MFKKRKGAIFCMLLLVSLLFGCVSTDKAKSVAEMPRPARSADLDLACAQLIVQFLTDANWNKFASEYSLKIKAAHPGSEALETVPLLFISEVKNNLRTLAGNPLNYSNLTDQFKYYLGNAVNLDRFIRQELPRRYPELYAEFKARMAQLTGMAAWEWSGPEALPRIRVSRAIGLEADMVIDNIDYIINDPRFEQKSVIPAGKLEIPALALSVKMEPYDETRFKFTADIIDYLQNDGSVGKGIERWNAFVLIAR